MIGKTLNHYEILEPLGAGGMGEVYLARDTRLDRKVAIKVLPGEYASDPERLARFKQEARAAAALNHPHIAVVHDIGSEPDDDGGDIHFMVQEYLEGHSLRERLGNGALPLDRTLALSIEIGEALIAAHKAGIVHRDLKPDNIFVTEEGHAKVLDFGLAKLTEVVAPEGSELTVSPTALGTVAGQVVGTAGYMAPEQVNGLAVDQRADLFAFGCVLYEMTTGRRAFSGENVHEILARILSDTPAPIADVRESAPPELAGIVRKALVKEADRRYQSAVDLNIDLRQLRDDLAAGTATVPALQQMSIESGAPPRGQRGASWMTVGIAALVAALVAGFTIWTLMRGPVADVRTATFRIDAPPGTTFVGNALAVSPDGDSIVFRASDSQTTQLYLRRLDRLDTEPIAGTTGAARPFFSSDGDSVAFVANGDLKKASLSGGEPSTLCEDCASGDSDGTWHRDTIIFDRDGNLYEIPAGGAVSATLVVGPNAERGEGRYDRPEFSPTGDAVVFEMRRAGTGPGPDGSIALLDLESGRVTEIAEEGTDPVYLPSGHVLYARGTTIYALQVDADRLEPVGLSTPVAQQVLRHPYGASYFGVSSDGVFAYRPDTTLTEVERTLVWVDADGNEEPVGSEAGEYIRPRISPDGTKIAMERVVEGAWNLWVWDDGVDTIVPWTQGGFDLAPAWTSDSSTFAFSSARPGALDRDIYLASPGESDSASPLHSAEEALWPVDQLEDGRIIVHAARGDRPSYDVMLLDVEAETLEPILDGDFTERNARLSPGGEWLAYTSDESGRDQVFVQRLDGAGVRLPVSPPGGTIPAWSPDGSELYYVYEGRMWAATLELGTGASLVERRELFITAPYLLPTGLVPYDVHPQTGRFLMVKNPVASTDPTDPDNTPHIVVVLNWFEEVERRLSPGR